MSSIDNCKCVTVNFNLRLKIISKYLDILQKLHYEFMIYSLTISKCNPEMCVKFCST